MILGGQADNDIVNYVNSGSALYTGVVTSDTLNLGAGDDAVSAGANATTFADFNWAGNDGNDTLTFGVTAADTVLAGSLKGGDGNDTIFTGGLTAMLVNGNQGTDTINVNRAGTTSSVVGGQGIDTINVTANGNLTGSFINGNKDDDIISSAGTPTIGTTTVRGGQGDDVINFASVTNTTTGTLTLEGDLGADTMTGAAAATVINGGAGIDGITGGAGNDTLNGGAGADTINANGGSDDIIIGATTDFGDVITGFSTGVDQLDLSATDIQSTSAGFTSGAQGALNFGTSGFFAIDTDYATASATNTAAEVTTAAITGFANIDANETAYILLTTNDDAVATTFLYRATANGDGSALASAEFVATINAVQLDGLVAQDFVLR